MTMASKRIPGPFTDVLCLVVDGCAGLGQVLLSRERHVKSLRWNHVWCILTIKKPLSTARHVR